MALTYYNRYRRLNTDDQIVSPPFVKLDEKQTDDIVIYDVAKTRLDKLSQQYYGTPYFGWLILMANPEYNGLEWNILDGQIVRIPFPLEDTIKEYETKLSQRIDYYG